jgi:hypothetical protein
MPLKLALAVVAAASLLAEVDWRWAAMAEPAVLADLAGILLP